MGERPRRVDYAHGPLGGAIIIAVAPGTEIADDRGSVYVVDEQHAVLGRKGAVYVTPAMYERLKAAVPLAPSDRLPSSTPPPAQRAAHGGPDDRKGSRLNDLPRVKRAGQAVRGGDDDA